MKKRYYLTTIFTIVLCLFVTLSACMETDEMPSEGDSESIEAQENEGIASDNIEMDLSDITYRDAINYQEVLDNISIPEIERIEKIYEYNADFPKEIQDAVALYIREESDNYESLEQYKAEYQRLINDTNKSNDEFDTFPGINEILDVRIGDDELGSCDCIIPVDLNADGEDEYLLETYYGDAYLGIVVKEEGRYALAGMYYHRQIPMILVHDNQKYVVADNMIITMDDSKEPKEWDILTLQKSISDYKLVELYSLSGFDDINILEEFNAKDLAEQRTGEFDFDENHYFYSTSSIVLPDSVHRGYDKTITVWTENSEGQLEIVKVYLLVADLEITPIYKEQAYLLEEHQQYIY